MRPIKFRGKAVMAKHVLDYQDIPNFQRWVKGSLIVDGDNYYIVGDIVEASEDGLLHEWWAKVHRDSVGQYTGLADKNGVEIYEGDISRLEGHVDMFIEFVEGAFVTKSTIKIQRINWEPLRLIAMVKKGYEVIGNIYENKNLLEESQ